MSENKEYNFELFTRTRHYDANIWPHDANIYSIANDNTKLISSTFDIMFRVWLVDQTHVRAHL